MGVLGPLLPPQMLQEPCGLMKTFIWMNSKKCAGRKRKECKLLELANHLEIDELVIITWTHDHARRSYELLAEAA